MWLYHIGPQWAKRLLLTGDTITGAEAAQIGLALKAVPAADLEGEVNQLLERMAKIDADLLTANKRIVNIGLELMGARTLQRLAAEMDARGHLAASAAEFRRTAKEQGLRAALTERDGKFGDGRARVRADRGGDRVDQRPALGLVPWLAFLRRALVFSFLVRFDIGPPGYRAAPQATSRSASHVLITSSASTPASAALSHP